MLDELEALIVEQHKDDRYGIRVWHEDIVQFSLDGKVSSSEGEDTLSKFLSNEGYRGSARSRSEWRCPVHERAFGYLNTDGQAKCRACDRERGALRRQTLMGMKKRVYACVHGQEFRKAYPGTKKTYCRRCKTDKARAYRQSMRELSKQASSPETPKHFEERKDVNRVG